MLCLEIVQHCEFSHLAQVDKNVEKLFHQPFLIDIFIENKIDNSLNQRILKNLKMSFIIITIRTR